ncbi:unnamed protein product [Closterium sp. Naga37s-1]|nr:unnamed protein product [Closterium sp. Naga37s-1]
MAGAAERRVLIMGDGGSPAGAAMGDRAGGGRQHVLHLAHPKTGASLAGARWRVGSRGACGHWDGRGVRGGMGGGVLHAAGRGGGGGGVVQRRALLVAAGGLRAPRTRLSLTSLPHIKPASHSACCASCCCFSPRPALHIPPDLLLPPCAHRGICGGAAGRVSARLLPRCPLPPPLHQVSAAHAPHMPSSHTFLLLPCRPLSPRTPPHATLCPYLLPHPPAPHSPSTLHVPLAAVCRAWGSEGEVKQSQQGGQRLASPPATTATQPKHSHAITDHIRASSSSSLPIESPPPPPIALAPTLLSCAAPSRASRSTPAAARRHLASPPRIPLAA